MDANILLSTVSERSQLKPGRIYIPISPAEHLNTLLAAVFGTLFGSALPELVLRCKDNEEDFFVKLKNGAKVDFSNDTKFVEMQQLEPLNLKAVVKGEESDQR